MIAFKSVKIIPEMLEFVKASLILLFIAKK